MTFEDYTRQFATVSDRRLIAIIDHPEESEALAMEAAREELVRRNLPADEVAAIRAELNGEEARRSDRKARKEATIGRIRAATAEASETFIVHPDAAKQEKRHVRILVLIIVLLFVPFVPNLALVPYYLGHAFDRFLLAEVLPLVLLPIAAVLLWKRRIGGWYIGALITLHFCIGAIVSVIVEWNYEPSGTFALDLLFEHSTREQLVLRAVFMIGLATLFQMRRTVSIYQVTAKQRWLTIAATCALVALEWLDL